MSLQSTIAKAGVCSSLLYLLSGCGGSGSSAAPTPTAIGASRCFTSAGEPLKIIDETFNTGNGCGFTASWEEVLGPIGSGIDECSLQYTLVAGERDEITPARVQVNGDGLTQLSGSERQQYIRLQWQDFFAPGYQFARSGQKVARFYDSQGVTSGVSVEIGNENSHIQLFYVVSNGSEQAFYFQNFSQVWTGGRATGVPEDEILNFDFEALLPSRDTPGFARLRFNGVELYVETDDQVQSMFDDNCLQGFSGFWVGGNFSNAGEGVGRTSNRFIDNIRAFVKN